MARQTTNKGDNKMTFETMYFVDYHLYGWPEKAQTLRVWASSPKNAEYKFWEKMTNSEDYWIITGVSKPGDPQ
jgi:hypothetical protein